jgi:hypothetical protein
MAKKKKKTVGLTTKQKKLPKALQMAILKKQKKGRRREFWFKWSRNNTRFR